MSTTHTTQHVAEALGRKPGSRKSDKSARGKGPRTDKGGGKKRQDTSRLTVRDLEHRLSVHVERVNQELQGINAELGALKKNHLSDRELGALRDKVTALGRKVGGFSSISKQRHKDMTATIAELEAQVESLNAGMEDLRAQLDDAHLKTQRSGFKSEVAGDWQVGHLVFGTLAALAYLGAGAGISKVLDTPLNAGGVGLSAAFAAGVAGFEAVKEAA